MKIFFLYWKWHYFEQPKKILKAFKNFLSFGIRFFSIFELLSTLFSPWHRYYEPYGRGFDLKVWANAFVSNLIFRTIGMVIRTIIIFGGIFFEILIFLGGLFFLFFWFFLPLIFFLGLAFSLKLLFF